MYMYMSEYGHCPILLTQRSKRDLIPSVKFLGKFTSKITVHLKGHCTILKILFLTEIHLTSERWFLVNKYKIQEFLKKVKKSSFFVKHAQTGDEVNKYSCCCLRNGYSKPKCHNLHIGHLIFVSVQKFNKNA